MTSPEAVHKSAVIGAGIAGLAAVKNCLEQGIEPVCFEQHDEIGGIWYYTPEVRPNQGAAAFHNLVTNTSRETSCFTDFPIPEHYPQYMSHRQFLTYIQSYADNFRLKKHIRFRTRVVRVWPVSDFASTGRWNVSVRSHDSDEEEHLVFDSVFVCCGMLVDPFEPDFPGRDIYQGRIMHMWHYRTPDVFSNKRVLVIGNQHSAGDAASDAASCALQVYMSPGRGGLMVLSRLNARGESNELLGLSRFIKSLISQRTLGRIVAAGGRARLDYAKLGIQDGSNPFTDGVIMVNDELQYKLSTGLVKAVPPVLNYTETGVSLEGGQSIDVDIILLATGYKSNYNFIDVPSIKGKDFRVTSPNALNLYKWTFPVDLSPPTLLMADAINVMGSHICALDMRTRWGALVFSGKCRLPDRQTMAEHANKERKHELQYCKGKVKLMWYDYCDSLAQEIGCRPNFFSLFLRSPALAYKVYFGPLLPQHYRLLGPGSSPDAWDNSRAAYDRVYPAARKGGLIRKLLWLLPVLLAIFYFR